MEKEKEGFVLVLPDEAESLVRHLAARDELVHRHVCDRRSRAGIFVVPVGRHLRVFLLELVHVHARFIDVEAGPESEDRPQIEAGDESARGVPVLLEKGCEHRQFAGRHALVVDHAVESVRHAGHERIVRRQGPRGGAHRVLEHDAAGGQLVEAGRCAHSHGTMAVDAHPVGTERVDRDEDHVQRRTRFAQDVPAGADSGNDQNE